VNTKPIVRCTWPACDGWIETDPWREGYQCGFCGRVARLETAQVAVGAQFVTVIKSVRMDVAS